MAQQAHIARLDEIRRAMWKEMKVVVYVENKVTYFNGNVHVKIS